MTSPLLICSKYNRICIWNIEKNYLVDSFDCFDGCLTQDYFVRLKHVGNNTVNVHWKWCENDVYFFNQKGHLIEIKHLDDDWEFLPGIGAYRIVDEKVEILYNGKIYYSPKKCLSKTTFQNMAYRRQYALDGYDW